MIIIIIIVVIVMVIKSLFNVGYTFTKFSL